MNDMINSKYFFYGSAISRPGQGFSQYALYEPISDRFVMTSQFPNSLVTVLRLFAGKASLRLCRLSSAVNFNPTLLDNTCCLNWTIADKTNLVVSRGIDNHITADIYDVTELTASKELVEPELIVENQEYLFAVYNWTTFEERRDWLLLATDGFFETENDLCSMIELPMEISQTTKDLQEVYNIIFTELDFSAAKERVETILMKYK